MRQSQERDCFVWPNEKVNSAAGKPAGGPLRAGIFLCVFALWYAGGALAQTSVVTQHNDIGRTGQNTNETILTPANVNATSFGKLFSYNVDGWVYAQPLYLPGVTMGSGTPQAGTTHNVIFIATEHDSLYAFDADSNNAANANPLWQITLLDNAHGVPSGVTATTVPNGDVSTGDIVPEIGITSTGVIDPTTNTWYVVGKTKEPTNPNGPYVQRLHAIDITTGAEKLGGPMMLSASVAGNGNGSSGGTLKWDPEWENNRASLLLLNGIVYIGFGSHGDNGPWHGWILAYNAATLAQTGAWCSSPNGSADGIWMGGSGLAADVPDPVNHPFGRLLTSTGNGSHSAPVNTTVPLTYDNTMNYGDSIIKLDLANGVPTMNSNGTTVGDDFTPHDQANLNNSDTDQASGGVLLLPDSVSGGKHRLAQLGKTGRIYILDQDAMGGYNPNNTSDPGESAFVNGLWGMPAYWNGNLYVWSTNDSLKAFSISSGILSSTFTSISNESAGTYSPTPTVSANGTTNGIVWDLKTDNYGSQGREILFAHDGTNVSKLLYSSGQTSSDPNWTRDNPGNSVKFIVPTVINGKVYTGSESQVSVFGLLNGATQAATPAISPASESFSPTVQVSITDSTPGVTIYYTTDGTLPGTGSTVYGGPFTVASTLTVQAIAAGTNFLQSPVASATYSLSTQTATPSFSPAPGAYTAVQSVTISTTTPNATIFYTTDGTTPGTTAGGSTLKYSGPVSVGATETLKAIATATSLSASAIASGLYTVDLGGVNSINFGSGFTAGSMALLGNSQLNGTALRLTDGGGYEASAAWFNVQANIASFTNDFTFLVTPASTSTADGFAFVIQGNNASAIGPLGGGLAYGPDTPSGTPGIPNSVAIKFDLYSNDGEGSDSTGLYTNGASPTIPFVDLTGSGIDLHSGDQFKVHMTYNGTNLVMTITDAATNATFTHTWPIDIPGTVGGPTAYVGFTAGTGSRTAVQDILTWTLAANQAQPPTLASIAITPASPSAAAGTTLQFHATGTFSDNSTQDLTSTVTWSSSNTAAATIGASGLATGVTAGQNTTITAATGGISSTTILTVTAAALSSITVTPANPSAAAGTTLQFHAMGTYSDKSTKDLTSSATWASANASGASITAAGLATAGAAGQTSAISATSGGISGSTTLTITAATLTSIAVSPVNPSAPAGTSVQFRAIGTYSDASTKDITTTVMWASSNTAAASISAAGLATAGTAGQSSSISATLGSVSASTTFTTTPAALKSVAVTPANPSVQAGSTLQFHATATYTDNSTNDITASSTWTSSNTTAATINAAGLASAVTGGQTSTIGAASAGISGSTTLTVTVVPVTLKSIAVTPANPSAQSGSTLQFHATGTYSDNSTKDLTASAAWTSSNTTAATINAAGLASAITGGQTSTIGAASTGISGSTTLTVTAVPVTLKSIAVTPANPSAQAGSTLQFHATGTYSDNSTKDLTATATWASSNTTAATINAAGLASAVTGGQSATISVASAGISGSTTLTVTAVPVTLKSIAVTPANPSAQAGSTLQFHATGTYSDNSTKDLTATAAWTSSNTSAATINTAALALGVTGGQSTTISATSAGVSGSTTLTVTAAASGVSFGSGFTAGSLALNGSASLNGTRLRLTDGGGTEAGSGWFATPVNVQSFTNDFSIQLTNPNADGMTFTIQNAGVTALGPTGGGLGYGPDAPGGAAGIGKSVAVKFDLYNNAGEGTNSTGLYTNGASPTTPATTLGGGVNLHSGDILKVHMAYDGTTLTMTITDTTNTADTFTTSWPVNIPATVGGNTAFVGFTGATGATTATQEVVTWTFASTSSAPPKTPVVYQTAKLPGVSSGPTYRTFQFAGFPDLTGTILDATKVGDNVTIPVNIAAAGTYDVQISYKKTTTRGIWQLAINGTNVGAPVDEYLASDAYAVSDLGNFTFPSAGSYSFKFTVTGQNPSSSGFNMSFDDFTLTPQ